MQRAPAPAARATARRFLASVWAAVLAGAVVRLVGLDRLSLWLDETTSVRIARQSPAAIWQDVGDTHPPLYHLLLHGWLLLGTGDGWVRLLSSLLGIATVPALYALGCALVGRRVALGAAWLLALLPWHIWYSQEARMYAAVALLGTLALLAGARWLRQPGPGWAAAYVLCTLAGLYCEYSMFVLWPAAVVALPVLTRWPRGRAAVAWLGLQLAVLLGLVPLRPFFAAHFPIFTSPVFLQMRFGAWTPLLGLMAGAGVVVVAGAGLAARRWARAHPAGAERLARAAGIGLLLGAVGLMLVPGGMTAKRVLLITAPLICLGGAWALAPRPVARGQQAARRSEPEGAINRAATDKTAGDENGAINRAATDKTAAGGWGGRGLLAVLAASVVAGAVMFATVPKEPWRDVVAAIEAAARPGDIVLLAPPWTTVPFDYYDHGRLPRTGVTPADLPTLPARLAPYRRAWLVLAEDRVSDPQGQVPRRLATDYPLRASRAYYQIQVQLFALGSP
jgi:4-amino-4-deoxy-L-arabinose transferase-like glycosyltransferase